MSMALGFKNAPHCANCMARKLDSTPSDILAPLMTYFDVRDCYRAAWAWAHEQENVEVHNGVPDCLSTCGVAASPQELNAERENVQNTSLGVHAKETPKPLDELEAHSDWDAGAMSCGDLVLELRLRFQSMPPKTILKLCASDISAPQDLPAWCRLTGHKLLRAEPPHYWIQRKE